MTRRPRTFRPLPPATFVAALVLCACATLLVPVDVLAQCPLCRTALEQGGAETAKAMNLGILVLLIPPVAIFCTIFAVAYRQQKGGGGDENQ